MLTHLLNREALGISGTQQKLQAQILRAGPTSEVTSGQPPMGQAFPRLQRMEMEMELLMECTISQPVTIRITSRL